MLFVHVGRWPVASGSSSSKDVIAGFVATASARLNPVLAPRGFPYDGRHNGVTGPGVEAARNHGAVLFHCDSKDELAEVMGRYHGWSER